MQKNIFIRCWAAAVIMTTLSSVHGQQALPPGYLGTNPVSFVRTWDALSPEINEASLNIVTDITRFKMTTMYVDGLGRPVQTVLRRGSLATGSPSTDMVSPVLYDEFGRQQYQYLPFAASDHGGNNHINDGFFKINPFQQDSAFNKGMFGDESWYYSQTEFEASPLNRPLKAMAPGNSWIGSERGVETKYWFNTLTDSVRIWKVSDVSGAFGSYTTTASYAANELYKNVAVDEHGNQVIEFKDKEGLVILKKIQLTANVDTGTGKGYAGWLSTYYIYDTLSRLRCVVQPKGVELLLANSWDITALSGAILNEQCFRYEYDGRSRKVMKKVPGAGQVWMVYDARDRVVLTQDSLMRAAHQWLYTKYDGLNRPIATGLLADGDHYDDLSFHLVRADTSSTYPAAGAYTVDTLTQTFYDDYSWRAGQGNPLSAARITTYDGYLETPSSNWPYPQNAATQSSELKAKVTGTKAKVLGTSTYLYTLRIYDDKGRVVQLQMTNITGGTDIVNTQYSWNGQPLLTIQKQEKAGTNTQISIALTKIAYDSLWRVSQMDKKVSHSEVSSGSMPGAWTTIVINEYNALGQLKTKHLAPGYDSGEGLEDLVYDYNIRSWMLGMNRGYIKDDSTNYFGFELGYDRTANIISGASYANAQYNGNIGGMTWKSKGDAEKRKYDFDYDAANRILSADFNQYTSGSFSKDAGVDFSMYGMSYDANGNIYSMNQRGLKIGGSETIDSLVYGYNNNSNRLNYVTDKTNDGASKLGDFKEITNDASQDYTYDGNGNMYVDNNKDIAYIHYNHLNLPDSIVVTDEGHIVYTYDATGNKLKKTTTEGATVTTTLYLSGSVFRNDTLEFIAQEEGRIRFAQMDSSLCTPQPNRLFYDYFLKDHLGNIRMVLTDQQEDICYIPATVEDATYETEEDYYDIDNSRRVDKTTVGASSISSFDDKIYRVHGGTSGEKTGLGITLKVMAGDEIKIMAESYYTMPGGGPGTPTGTVALSELLSAFVGSGAVSVGHAGIITTDVSDAWGNSTAIPNFISGEDEGTNNARAFVNWILFDEQFKFVAGDADPVEPGGGYKLHDEFINNPIVATKSGYLYIYVSNESDFAVFFDNLVITDTPGPILEETHYYPFGLTMAGISSKALAFGGSNNRFKYSGKEEQRQEFSDGSGLEEYDFGSRFYNPQIGRWHNLDRQSEKYHSVSPFAFVSNNPIIFVDPNGEEIWINYGDNNQRAQYINGDLYDESGKKIKMKKNTLGKFAQKVFDGLNKLRSEDFGRHLVDRLVDRKEEINFFKSETGHSITRSLVEIKTNEKSADIFLATEREVAPTEWENTGDEINTGMSIPFFVKIAHELGHAQSHFSDAEGGVWYYNEFHQPVSVTEWDAMSIENFVRAEHNLPMRTSYGTPIAPDGFVNGQSYETPKSHMIQSKTFIYAPSSIMGSSAPQLVIVSYTFIPRPKPIEPKPE